MLLFSDNDDIICWYNLFWLIWWNHLFLLLTDWAQKKKLLNRCFCLNVLLRCLHFEQILPSNIWVARWNFEHQYLICLTFLCLIRFKNCSHMYFTQRRGWWVGMLSFSHVSSLQWAPWWGCSLRKQSSSFNIMLNSENEKKDIYSFFFSSRNYLIRYFGKIGA